MRHIALTVTIRFQSHISSRVTAGQSHPARQIADDPTTAPFAAAFVAARFGRCRSARKRNSW